MADGASLVLLASKEGLATSGGTPIGRIVATAQVGIEPMLMLTGNVLATERALEKAGLGVSDIDLFEINESFAAIPLDYQAKLKIDPEKINCSGGAIALGHPLGATGGILLGTLLDNLKRVGGRYGIVSICGGAGMASTIVVECLAS